MTFVSHLSTPTFNTVNAWKVAKIQLHIYTTEDMLHE
jgi:hypothetical protein